MIFKMLDGRIELTFNSIIDLLLRSNPIKLKEHISFNSIIDLLKLYIHTLPNEVSNFQFYNRSSEIRA